MHAICVTAVELNRICVSDGCCLPCLAFRLSRARKRLAFIFCFVATVSRLEVCKGDPVRDIPVCVSSFARSSRSFWLIADMAVSSTFILRLMLFLIIKPGLSSSSLSAVSKISASCGSEGTAVVPARRPRRDRFVGLDDVEACAIEIFWLSFEISASASTICITGFLGAGVSVPCTGGPLNLSTVASAFVALFSNTGGDFSSLLLDKCLTRLWFHVTSCDKTSSPLGHSFSLKGVGVAGRDSAHFVLFVSAGDLRFLSHMLWSYMFDGVPANVRILNPHGRTYKQQTLGC
jgi:hypothetical protein